MAKQKKAPKKKLIGTVNMLTGQYTPIKKRKAKKGVRPADRDQDWDTLEELCQRLADAQQEDSWKGGGDPDAIPIIEAELELAKLKLRTHIDKMRRYYEGSQ